MTAAGFRPDTAVALYLWNAAVGQAFHFPLQTVEVALRNVISRAYAAAFGPDWWKDQACLRVLGNERAEDINKVARRIRHKYGIEPFNDQVVASLMLGFWAALLKREYNAPVWNKQAAIAFPHLDTSTIRHVSGTANTVQDLRNRMFHHEPLLGRSLSDDYGQILKLLGWICPVTRDWVRGHSSVAAVLRTRPR